MKKIVLMLAGAVCTAMSVSAATVNVVTNGDETAWTLAKLAAIDTAGVTQVADTFTLSRTIVIAKGDSFKLTGGAVVKLEKGVSFEVEGVADFVVPADQRVLFTRSADGVVPGIVYFKSDAVQTLVKNIDFEYVGLKNWATKGLDVDSCTFRYHAASTSNGSYAITLGASGAEFHITNSIFEKNDRGAIGGAANSVNPVTIENCHFLYNGTSNRQYPQLNLTAASTVVVRNCVVIGDPKMTRVGGIMVADLLGAASNPTLLVENCFVKDTRYGIAVYSGQKAVVRNNVLVDNNAETNPNNGGSGINIYDTTGKQHTTLTGNFITGSLWGVTVVATKEGTVANLGRVDVDPSSDDYNPGQNVFYNNGNGGVIYDLYNNSSSTVYAQNNFWLTAASFKSEAIDTCIFDKNDDEKLGEVIYKVGGNSTVGIENVPVLNPMTILSGGNAIYNLNGVRTDELRKGLNIVRKDGKTVKIVK